MSLLRRGGPATATPTGTRRRVDVLYVSLGSTLGLDRADANLVDALRASGLDVEVAQATVPRDVRTLMLTDLVQARAAARAAREALTRVEPRRIIYSTTTAAMFWPRPGAIRFDALAQTTRPGHHGCWQRPLERHRLRRAPLLVPCDFASLQGAPADISAQPQVVVPIPLGGADPTSPAGDEPTVDDVLVRAALGDGHAVAVTYAADPRKKGLDRVLAAWQLVRRPGEVLLVAGRDAVPEGFGSLDGVRVVGKLPPRTFRALVRAVGVLAIGPRREDYGLVQLEALAEGARVATTAAPGAYAALPLLRVLWPEQVVPDADADDPVALGAAIRHAIDARPDARDLMRATAAVEPWRPDAVRTTVERDLMPALMNDEAPRPS